MTRERKGKVSRSLRFLGGVDKYCSEPDCRWPLTGNEERCPHCGILLKDEIDKRLAPVERDLDEVLVKHHGIEGLIEYEEHLAVVEARGEDEAEEP